MQGSRSSHLDCLIGKLIFRVLDLRVFIPLLLQTLFSEVLRVETIECIDLEFSLHLDKPKEKQENTTFEEAQHLFWFLEKKCRGPKNSAHLFRP